jgi:hypothetical protein
MNIRTVSLLALFVVPAMTYAQGAFFNQWQARASQTQPKQPESMLDLLPMTKDIRHEIVEDHVQSLIGISQTLGDYRFRLRETTTTHTPVLMTVGCTDA